MKRAVSGPGAPSLRVGRTLGRLLPLLLALQPCRTIVAQDAPGTKLSLDLGASYSLPPGGSEDLASSYLNGGLRLDGTFGQGGFFGGGLTGGLALDEQGASWGAARMTGGWFQPLSPRWFLGITFKGEAFTVGDPAPYRAVYAVAEPELRLVAGRAMIRLSGYGGIGSSEVTIFETFVRDTRFGRRIYEVGFAVATDLWAWGGALDISGQFGPFWPHVAVEGYESPQGPYAVGRLGFELQPPGGAFFAEASYWDSPDGDDVVFVAGIRVRTGSRSGFEASGGRYGPDPLLDTVAAGGVGAGISLEVARLGSEPEFSWTVRSSDGLLEMRLRLPDAGAVECAGDFTGWERTALSRSGDTWTLVAPIGPGVHHFGFFVDGEWFVPADAPGLSEDDWGRIQATIVVDDPAGTDVTP